MPVLWAQVGRFAYLSPFPRVTCHWYVCLAQQKAYTDSELTIWQGGTDDVFVIKILSKRITRSKGTLWEDCRFILWNCPPGKLYPLHSHQQTISISSSDHTPVSIELLYLWQVDKWKNKFTLIYSPLIVNQILSNFSYINCPCGSSSVQFPSCHLSFFFFFFLAGLFILSCLQSKNLYFASIWKQWIWVLCELIRIFFISSSFFRYEQLSHKLICSLGKSPLLHQAVTKFSSTYKLSSLRQRLSL